MLCSGQSNMGVPTSYILNGTAAAAAPLTAGAPLHIATGAGQATQPRSADNVQLRLPWTPATPEPVSLRC